MLYVLAMMECCWVTAVGPCTPSRHAALVREVGVLSRLQHRAGGGQKFVRGAWAYTTPSEVNPNALRCSLILYPVADGGDLETTMELYRTGMAPTMTSEELIHTHEDSFQSQQDLGYSRFHIDTKRVLLSAFKYLSFAMQIMQEHRLRHGDLKPPNVLIHRGRVVLSDFGFAGVYDGFRDDMEILCSDGNANIRNHRYRAPEVINNLPRCDKTDVYSSGCTFVEIVATLMWERCKLNPWPDLDQEDDTDEEEEDTDDENDKDTDDEKYMDKEKHREQEKDTGEKDTEEEDTEEEGDHQVERFGVHVFAKKLRSIKRYIRGISREDLRLAGIPTGYKRLFTRILPRMLRNKVGRRPNISDIVNDLHQDLYGSIDGWEFEPATVTNDNAQ